DHRARPHSARHGGTNLSPSRILQPEGWPRPSGYSSGVLAEGRQVFIAGLVDQVAQALRNVLAVLAQAQGRPEHIVRMTWYLTSRTEYLAHLDGIGTAYRGIMG